MKEYVKSKNSLGRLIIPLEGLYTSFAMESETRAWNLGCGGDAATRSATPGTSVTSNDFRLEEGRKCPAAILNGQYMSRGVILPQ